MESLEPAETFKVVMLGEGRVGKTSLILRYVKGTFDDHEPVTKNVSCLEKRVAFRKKALKLNIWDTAGQENFHALTKMYYKEANAVCIVYDVTDPESENAIRRWIRELREYAPKDILIFIVGNKVDLDPSQYNESRPAEELAKDMEAVHYYTSAKCGKNVKELFKSVARHLMENFEKEAEEAPVKPKRQNTKGLVKIESKEEKKRGSCCS